MSVKFTNPLSNISYTNKDFQTIYPELLNLVKNLSYKYDPTASNESDPAVLLIKLAAIIADKNNYNIDKNVLECFPNSVTQEKNARQLFEQLGYTMRWYRGGSTQIAMRWIGDKITYTDEYNTEYPAVFAVPDFTMVCDDENSIIYSIVKGGEILADGTSVMFDAIQGIATEYSINGNKLITSNMLDNNNRLYFDRLNVAENGVFIKNATENMLGTESNHYGGWKRVENLATELLGKTVYKFGITQDGSSCYIEFPNDYESLIGEGIYITYILTNGEEGNVAKEVIEKFYSPINVPINGNMVELNSNNVLIVNNAVRDGANPETIASAYKGYQKTVGTFNTLVTLRDYMNAIQNSGLVSNGFICDRTNDIQTSYKIITHDGKLTKKIYSTETDEENTSYMNAFDLKLFALEHIINPNSPQQYNLSFEPVLNDMCEVSPTIENVLGYLADMKCVQHDFQPLLRKRICMIKNVYPLSCNIIPQYRLTEAQRVEMQNNILSAIYKNLNSKEVNFGENLSYEKVYNIILSADERIKAVTLDTLQYDTYLIYFDEEDNKFHQLLIGKMPKQICGYYNSVNNEFYEDSDFTNIMSGLVMGDICTDINTNKCYTYDPDKTPKFVENLLVEFQNEIYAKSVLNGNTQLLIPDGDFQYALNQNYLQNISDIERLTTNLYVRIKSGTTAGEDVLPYTGIGEYTLKENEGIFLYAPNLIDDVQYTTYVKYQYIIKNRITPNTTYRLRQDESITFYWKDNDDKQAPYRYRKYGEGTIIQPNLYIQANTDTSEYVAYNNSTYPIGEGTITNATANETLNNLSKISLSSSQNITIKKINSTVLNNSTNPCYWMLNNKTDDGRFYKLFEKNQSKYMLQAGEYFIYTNSTKTEMMFLGAGTQITRVDESGNYEEMLCNVIDYTKIIDEGASALKDAWVNLPANIKLTATEMQYYSLGNGTTFRLEKYMWRTDDTYNPDVPDSIKITGIDIDNPEEYGIKPFNGGHVYNTDIEASWTAIPSNFDIIFSNGCKWERDSDENGHGVYIPIGEQITIQDAYPYESNVVPHIGARAYNPNFLGIQRSWHCVEGGTTILPVGQQLHLPPFYDYELSDFVIKYKEPNSSSFTEIPNIDLGEDGWQGKSMLNIRMSSTLPQKLVENQAIKYYKFEDNVGVTLKNGTAENPLYILSDFGYDMDGGIDINVRRDSLDGTFKSVYMKIYVYRDSTVADNDITYNSDGSIKVDFDGGNGYKWQKDDVYTTYENGIVLTGDKTPFSENIKPTENTKAFNADSEESWQVVREKIASRVKTLKFKLQDGLYLLPINNTTNEIKTLTAKIKGIYGETEKEDVPLTCIFSNIDDFSDKKVYYLDFNTENISDLEYDDLTECRLIIHATFDTDVENTNKNIKSITFMPIFKYEPKLDNETFPVGCYEAVMSKMASEDKLGLYKYTHIVNKDEEISNPIMAMNFLNPNHIYSKYTICQNNLATNSINVISNIQ